MRFRRKSAVSRVFALKCGHNVRYDRTVWLDLRGNSYALVAKTGAELDQFIRDLQATIKWLRTSARKFLKHEAHNKPKHYARSGKNAQKNSRLGR